MLGLGIACAPVSASYLAHDQVAGFIDRMVAEHQFERAYLESLFGDSSRQDSIINAMNRPAEKTKPWFEYKKHFINERRISQGVEFWLENHDTLEKAYQDYGVNPEIIVAIIGVETYYGRNMGRYRVIDALSTLSFDYPKRSKFFTKQLEEYLLLTREQKKNPLELLGSYAGAMGYGQFIPSSYRAYAVDYDGDGVADIWANKVDAIGSVANYFARHGWTADGQVVAKAFAPKKQVSDFNKLGLDRTVIELAMEGLIPERDLPESAKVMPLELLVEDGKEYWIGLSNFYTITRYNHSHLYAMAVYQLSELIKERVGQ
ncbi:MAG: lytic murein transglycosylase B [bacterium]